jgi:hypothetical protein
MPAISSLVWWQSYSWVPILLVGPVILREFISIAFVLSDVLTLIIATTVGTDPASSTTTTTTYIERFLTMTHAIVDAMMSLLVTPKTWRSSNAAQRQTILARLVSKISLFMEVGVGLLMLCDCLIMSIRYIFINTGGQIRFHILMKSMICTRLYLGFLWTRRKNISKLIESMRGGAIEAPIYILDVLLHPSTSMGIDSKSPSSLSTSSSSATTTTSNHVSNGSSSNPKESQQKENQRTLLDYIRIALDIDDP